MVNFNMPVPTKHKGVIASELVSVDNTASSHRLDREIQERLSSDIFERFDLYHAITLKNTEYRHFVGGSTTSWAFSAASEVALIHLDLTAEKLRSIGGMRHNSHTDRVHGFQHSGVTQAHLLCDTSGRQLYFKELDYPQPLCAGDVDSIDPSTAEVMKPVATTPTAVS